MIQLRSFTRLRVVEVDVLHPVFHTSLVCLSGVHSLHTALGAFVWLLRLDRRGFWCGSHWLGLTRSAGGLRGGLVGFLRLLWRLLLWSLLFARRLGGLALLRWRRSLLCNLLVVRLATEPIRDHTGVRRDLVQVESRDVDHTAR